MRAEIGSITSQDALLAAKAFLSAHVPGQPRVADALSGAFHGGGLVLDARQAGQIVGLLISQVSADLPASSDSPQTQRDMRTDTLCVLPEFRGQGIGFALKLRERTMAMQQEVRRITWSVDGADSRQAYFAVRRLAAIARQFEREVGRGELVAEWWLSSSRVRTRLEGRRQPPDLADYLAAETPKLNPAGLDDRDLPIPCREPKAPERSLALVELPHDIHQLESQDPGLAAAWRDHIQAILQDAFQRGYLVTDFLYLKGERLPRSYYLLSHGEALLGM